MVSQIDNMSFLQAIHSEQRTAAACIINQPMPHVHFEVVHVMLVADVTAVSDTNPWESVLQ